MSRLYETSDCKDTDADKLPGYDHYFQALILLNFGDAAFTVISKESDDWLFFRGYDVDIKKKKFNTS